MAHAARLQHVNAAIEAPFDLHVLQLDHVVGGVRDAVAGELGGAQQLGGLHVHVERDAQGAEVLREGVDELLEAPVGGNAERHARQAVEHGAPRPELLHLLPRPVEEGVGRELDGRDVAQREEPALLEGGEIPPEALGDPAELVRRLLQREVDPRFPAPRPREQKLQAEEGLPRPRPTLDDGRARARQPAAEHRIEPVAPRRDALGGRDRLGGDDARAPHPREEREPVGADLQEVTAGDVVRPAELQDLDLADGGQLVTPVGEPDDAIGDRELGVARDLRLGVLADEEARRSPARRVDGEIVDERSDPRGVAERLEAVDDDDRRLLALDPGRDRGERRLDALRPEHGAQVGEDDLPVDQALVEKGELLHVADELHRRLGERREIEAFLAFPREVKEHLEREEGLPRAGLSGDHVDGANGEPASEDAIEGFAARREALETR